MSFSEHEQLRQYERFLSEQVGKIQNILDIKEASASLGLTVAGLRRMLREQRGPAYVKVGRLIRFRRVDLLAFVERNLVLPKEAE
jgi:excisionase family DNA binding protein